MVKMRTTWTKRGLHGENEDYMEKTWIAWTKRGLHGQNEDYMDKTWTSTHETNLGNCIRVFRNSKKETTTLNA